ncbi:Photosynthesis system II assembly factor Ycf48/Hcf136-like domain protein [Raphanus sativus]|nr:Photosynthesis system II assembly factor Ycf48/Hcf136-like domain protein [Raphanus sativus]
MPTTITIKIIKKVCFERIVGSREENDMPLGVVWVVLSFPDEVVRTSARVVHVVGCDFARPTGQPLVVVQNTDEKDFPVGGTLDVLYGGSVNVWGEEMMEVYESCSVAVPIGGTIIFNEHIDRLEVPTQSANLTPISHLLGIGRIAVYSYQNSSSKWLIDLTNATPRCSLASLQSSSCSSLQEEAWAVGGSGILLRTRNGGKSLVMETVRKAADSIVANLYAVKFVDDKKGFVLGNDGVLLRYVG